MNQECWRLINNVCWCETALKLNELSSGSSEWPQPQPSVVPDSTPLPLIRCSPSSIVALPILRGCPLCPPSSPSPSSVAAFSILHHRPSHSPSSPSPFSVIVLPILHHCPLHPPLSFPSCIISFSILHRCPSHYPPLPSPPSIAALSLCWVAVGDGSIVAPWAQEQPLALPNTHVPEEPARRLGSRQPSASLHMT